MLLSAAEFDQKIAQGQLRIALIGMSNIGKSYTAKRIAKADGFHCYDIDAQIQAKLGISNMATMAEWMGHPFTDNYNENATKYLDMEANLSLAPKRGKNNLVLDTTGSIIHIPDDELLSFNNKYLIVYIKASPVDIDTLIERYFKYPKPTIWGDCFHLIAGKPNLDSLLACYPDLLALRSKLYAKLANITISASELANIDMADEDILPLIRSYLS